MNRLKKAFPLLILPMLLSAVTVSVSGAVEIGDMAPDFELESTQGGKLKLSSLRGKNILLQFYVLDFTPG